MRLERTLDARPFILKWAEQVKLRMIEKGWNLKRLAHEVDKSPQFLSQLLSAYSHDRRRPVMPSYEIVEAIDKKLGLPKEQQYQDLGLGCGNQISLGASWSSDTDIVRVMQASHNDYEQQLQQNPEQRIRHLEAQVRILAEQLHINLSELIENR